LAWRREFKPDEINPDDIEQESLTGKEIINGFDKQGRPNIYL
jgi:hypothetical protein